MDGDTELVGGSGQRPAHVGFRSEPQGPAVAKTGGEGLGDEQPAVAAGDGGGIIQQGPGVQDFEDLGMGMAERGPVSFGQQRENLGELTAPGGVEGL